MPLIPISNTPGSATNAPTAATQLNDWLTQILADQANVIALQAALGGVSNSKISALPAAAALVGPELVPVVQSSSTVRTTITAIASLVASLASSQQMALSVQPGIDPTGTTNSWTGFTTALALSVAQGKTLLVDCQCRLTIGIDDSKCIFFRSGIKLQGTPAGVLIVDNSYIPAFVLHHTTDFVIRDLNIRYVGVGAPWDDTIAPYPALLAHFNDNIMKSDMAANFGNTFSGSGSSLFVGHTNPQSIVRCIGGVSRGIFLNCKFYVDQGVNAANFIPVCFSVDPQWLPNTLIPNNNQPVTGSVAIVPNDFDIMNCRIDGAYMGIVGSGGVRITNLVGARYSDLQKTDGTGPGGNSTYFAPPHLIYLADPDASFVNWQRNISNVYDSGPYVGGATRRNSGSGSLLSLKIAPCMNTVVDGYVSLRPDGAADILTNNYGNQFGSIKNFYFVYDSSVVTNDGGSVWGFRFPSAQPYNYLSIDGLIARDQAAAPRGFPIVNMTNVLNQNCDFKGVKVYLNDFTLAGNPGFGLSGNAMTLDADFYFNQYSSDTNSVGSSVNPGSQLVTNSDINIRVHGYRLFPVVFATPPSGTSTALLANWAHSTGTYVIQFSDNEVRSAVLTNGATTCTWAASGQGALLGLATTGASGTGTVATILFANSGGAAPVGSQVTISGVTPAGYNGTYTVLSSLPGSVSYTNATTGVQTVAGTVSNFVNATAQNSLAANYAGYKQRMTSMQAGKGIGNRIRVMDVTNGLESICQNGVVEEKWTQVWTGTPPAGLTFDIPMVIPATHNPDLFSAIVITSLGVSGGLTTWALGWSATPTALVASINPGAGSSTVTPNAGPITTNAGTSRTIRMTATGGTGFDGTGLVTISIRCATATAAG